MKLYYIPIILFLAFISCEEKENEAEILLRRCINDKINQNIAVESSIDFYEFSQQIENVLLKNRLISSNGKEDYKKLLINIEETTYPSGEKAMEDIKKIINANQFNFSSYAIRDQIFNQCPFKVYSSLGLGKEHIVYKELKFLKPLMDHGFYDFELMNKLFENIPDDQFDNITYRAPIIYLVAINLDFKYNSGAENPREIDPSKITGASVFLSELLASY